MLGIIGGSGFERFEEFEVVEYLNRETPFGLASSGFKKVRVNGAEFLFISRHGDHHELLPTEINYRANIFALKNNNAKAVVSFSTIKSLEKDLAPGDLVVPFQYIDRTKGVRASSFLGDGLIGYISLANPICEVMAARLEPLAAKQNFKTHFAKTYVCIEGPYTSTKAESQSYRQIGAQVIGMSHFPEYALAREAGLPYLPCCFVTEYDEQEKTIPHARNEELLQVMKSNHVKAFQLLKDILNEKNFWSGSIAPENGLRTGLSMARESIPQEKLGWVNILMA